jgi:hypothetical protein
VQALLRIFFDMMRVIKRKKKSQRKMGLPRTFEGAFEIIWWTQSSGEAVCT